VKINARGTRDPDRRAAAASPPELTGQAIAWRNLIDVDLVRSTGPQPAVLRRRIGRYGGVTGRRRAYKGPVTRAATRDHTRRIRALRRTVVTFALSPAVIISLLSPTLPPGGKRACAQGLGETWPARGELCRHRAGRACFKLTSEPAISVGLCTSVPKPRRIKIAAHYARQQIERASGYADLESARRPLSTLILAIADMEER